MNYQLSDYIFSTTKLLSVNYQSINNETINYIKLRPGTYLYNVSVFVEVYRDFVPNVKASFKIADDVYGDDTFFFFSASFKKFQPCVKIASHGFQTSLFGLNLLIYVCT